MFHDLAFENPDLDADDAVSRGGFAVTEIDVRAQRMKRHAAFAIPFRTCNFSATQPAGDVDTNTNRAQTQSRLNRTLHGAAERDPALELLRDAVGDKRGIDFRLADFEDVQVHFRRGQPGEFTAQLFDVGALLADQDARTSGINRDAALLVGTFDHDLGDRSRTGLLHDVSADRHVFMEKAAVFLTAGKPARIPGAVDAQPEPDRIDLMTHVTRPP